MLQDFRRRTTPDTGAARLAALRAAMAEAGVDAFLVPRADAHQGENVAPRDERLAWLTGFTGSAGLAIVTADRAVVFVDGRYRLQVQGQVDTDRFEVRRIPEDKPADWLAEALPRGGRLGFDPWLHTAREVEELAEALGPRQVGLVRVANLVDRAWADQPPPPARPMVAHPVELAGRDSAEKRGEIAKGLVTRDLAAAVLTLPDSIAWLLNVRGSDIARTPVALAFAILRRRRAGRALHRSRQGGRRASRAHLGPEVRVAPPEAFGPALDALKGRVAVDKASAPAWVSDRIAANGAAEVVWERDPCILPKAVKTPAEIAGARAAHLRDGAAMAEFLAWLDLTAPEGGLSEIDVVKRLEEIRAATGELQGHLLRDDLRRGAERGDRALPGDRGLEPAGGPGRAPAGRQRGAVRRRDHGHHPHRGGGAGAGGGGAAVHAGAEGAHRHVPARLAARGWRGGTSTRWRGRRSGGRGWTTTTAPGTGSASYLGVHEGPQSLSRRGLEPLLPGMILSIEPGYYREGAFGIRLENLAVVRPAEPVAGGDREMLGFEVLTLAPIDRRLIDAGLLDASERAWIDAYHARVAETLAPLVDAETARWLRAACQPL